MEFLSDQLYVRLAKRAGYPSLDALKRIRDLQQEWLDGGAPASLFMVSQLEGVIDAEQTREFEGWARQIVSSSGRIRKVDSPTEEVRVEHAFRAVPTAAVDVAVEVVEVDEDVAVEVDASDFDASDFDASDFDASDFEASDFDIDDAPEADNFDLEVADEDLQLLPDSDEIDLQNLGRFEETPDTSNECVFVTSEHTELFSDADDDFDACADPLADVLAILDEQDARGLMRRGA
jgi:hypothetical protein